MRLSTTLRWRMGRFVRRVASHPLASSSSSSQSSVPQPAPSQSFNDDDTACEFSSTASEASVSSIEEAFEDQNEEYTRMLLELEKDDPSALHWLRQSSRQDGEQTPHVDFLHRRGRKILMLIASLQTKNKCEGLPVRRQRNLDSRDSATPTTWNSARRSAEKKLPE